MKKSGLLTGVSDIHIILPNRMIFVEVKTPKGKQQPSQKEFEKTVKELGFEYYVWNCIEQAIDFVNLIKKDTKSC